jgi:uncharacterized protein (DUF362 family)
MDYTVSIIKHSKILKSTIKKAVDCLGGFKRLIKKDETILIKPNFNSPDPYPASSDPLFVKAVAEELYKNGAEKIMLGESSGPYWKPTLKVLEKTGMLKVSKDLNMDVHLFDKERWIKVKVKGKYLNHVHIAKEALKADKIIYLPCLKTHKCARFTLSLKLTMGLIKNFDRYKMHAYKLEEKIADINLAIKPSLVIMDARKCFVTGGPTHGVVKKPNVILASNDRVAIDVEAIKIIKRYKANNKVNLPVWQLPQIKAAVKLNLGAKTETDYNVVKK